MFSASLLLLLVSSASAVFLPLTDDAVDTGPESRTLHKMRTAPQLCPIEDGNLIDVMLFLEEEEECFDLCQRQEGCNFFRFYIALQDAPADADAANNVVSPPRPTQCFLFRSCGRKVEKASPDCMLNKENTIEVKPFIKSELDCREECQKERKCGYYKYFPGSDPDYYDALGESASSNNTTTILGTARSSGLDSQPGSQQRGEFCYVLRSCSKRMVDRLNCTLGVNNFLDVKLFVPSAEECEKHCQSKDGCRYYWWYPVERSEAPLYCYLYRQCAAKDREPEVALVMGGRHPGHYYLANKQHNDLIMRSDVCKLGTRQNVSLERAGAVAEFGRGRVVFCGGRNARGVHQDCLQYDPLEDVWSHHSLMLASRDEASSAKIGSTMYVLGGVGLSSVEKYHLRKSSSTSDISEAAVDASSNYSLTPAADAPAWVEMTPMPGVIARGCAVAVDDDTIMIVGGHDNTSTNSLPTGYELSVRGGNYSDLPPMNHPRRDHACLFVEFEKSSGILVTGGLGDNDEILDSAEFFDLKTRRWTLTSSLKQRRTEHAMSLIYGIPTVIGGLSDTEFLSSLEQFDKSSASWNVPLERDWRIINHALNSPRYEMAVVSIPVSKVQLCDTDDQ